MPDPDFEIPNHRLPPGFVETLDHEPTEPVTPRPAATVVMLREGDFGIEVLLVRRTRSAGFVPGAYVFPGGRVDATDADDEAVRRFAAMTHDVAAGRLALPAGDPPAIAYYVAALREAFEETGILVGSDGLRRRVPAAAVDGKVAKLQDELLEDRISFGSVLDELGARLNGSAIEYMAHWITPVVEPRRYDTRFFAAEVPRGTEARIDPREMNDAVWLSPQRAVQKHREGTLPMIFPTVRTLESLFEFDAAREVLDTFRGRRIAPILPRLVRTPTGVGLRID